MGNPRGQRRDFEALERRRLEGLRLFRKGVPQAQIARDLRVARQTVSRWVRQYREGGREALRQAGRAGRPPKLGAAQLRQIERMLLAGPEAFGYPTPLWTCPRVAEVIEARFGVRYHPGHVWKLLRAMGFSCQRPVGRAVERDEKAVEPWKRKRWPAMKKKPAGKGGRSSS
jgi:transposase